MKTNYAISLRKIFPFVLLFSVLCVFSFPVQSSKASLSQYQVTNGKGSKISLSGAQNVLWSSAGNNRYYAGTYIASGVIDLGFNFGLDGTTYNQIIVYASGLVTFGSSQISDMQTNDLKSTNVASIAGWWDNIGMSGGSSSSYWGASSCGTVPTVSFELMGSGTNHIMVIDYDHISVDRHSEGYYGEALSSWQIRIYENNGAGYIELYYDHMTGTTECGNRTGSSNSTTASIGVTGGSNNFISITPTGGTAMNYSSSSANDNIDLLSIKPMDGALFTISKPLNIQLKVNPTSPKTLSYGVINVGTSSTQCMTVQHSGTEGILVINSVTITGSSDFTIVSTPPSNSYAPGATGQYCIKFTPTQAGLRTATLTIKSNGRDSGLQSMSLVGIGQVADLTVDSTVRFKKTRTRLGDSLTQWIHIKSTGGSPLVFSSFTLIGADANQYFISHFPSNPIQPGVTDSLSITYVPTIEGKHTATLRLISNSFTFPIVDISLQGTGTLPHIVVTPALLLFDSTVREGDTVCKNITIWNPGTDTLKIFKNFLSSNDGDFKYFGLKGSDTLIAPDQKRIVTVCFSPKQQGSRQARLLLVTNIINTFETPRRDTGRLVSIDIRGTGIPFGVFGTSLNGAPFFDSAVVGVEICRADTLKNTGDADILVTSLTFTGGVFRQTGLPPLPFLLKARSFVTFTLCGTPDKQGLITGTLVFKGTTSGTSIAYGIPLGIYGLNSCATPTPGELFTAVVIAANSDSSQCVWVRNCGDIAASYTGAVSGTFAADYTITTIPNPSAIVAPGDSVQFCVTYKPSVVGTSNAVLNFTSPTAPNVDVPLNGAAGCASLTSEVAQIPNTGANGTNTFTFKITNTGSTPWSPGSATIVGAGKDAYKVISIVPDPILPGQDGIVTMEFHPPVGTEGDNFIAVVSWPNGGPCENAVVSVDLNGKSVVSSVLNSSASDGFILDQSYPNPSAGNTNFTYTTPREAEVRISLVDLTGKLVRTLITGRVSEGVHSVNFDAQSLPSGSYVYLLESGSVRLSRQLILTK